MTIRLTFAIDLLSDYHVGAGQRSGLTVDSALLRDYDETPVLRGTILAGLLRDGLQDLKALIDAHNIPFHNKYEAAGKRLFGTAKQRKKWAYSSGRAVNGSAGHAQDVYRARINPRTRRAAPQQLFREEEGHNTLKFTFTASCPTETEEDKADAALLTAAARLVRHLGSSRRRGRGACRLRLVQAEGFLAQSKEEEDLTEKALAEFKDLWLATESELDELTQPEPKTDTEPLALYGNRKRFRVVAYLEEPLLVSQRSEAANAYETLPIVPGTALLGAFASRAAHRLYLSQDTDAPAEFIQLFIRGALSVSSLLPAVEDNQELYPCVAAPKSLHQCEITPMYRRIGRQHVPNAHPAWNGLAGRPIECPECSQKLLPVTGFMVQRGWAATYKPKEREEIHIQVNRKTGRAKEGDLYEYIALEAGQWFVGELSCDTNAWARFQELTGLSADKPYELRLGKASQRGYGLTRLILEALDETEASPFTGQTVQERVTDAGSELSVAISMLLITDTIVTDDWGRFYQGFEKDWIAKLLKINKNCVALSHPHATSRIVDSFNGYRRMPRWRDEAIEAGSAVSIELSAAGLQQIVTLWQQSADFSEAEVSSETAALQWCLSKIEKDGIGLRRHEGFGRVAFNHPALLPNNHFDGALDTKATALLGKNGVGATNIVAYQARTWRKTLLQDKELEDVIDSAYAPLARLLFINRYQPLKQIYAWLETDKNGRPVNLARSERLWGDKSLVGRDQAPRVDEKGLKLIRNHIQTMAENAAPEMRALAIELISERIAQIIEEKGGTS